MLKFRKNLRLTADNSESAISVYCCNQRTKEYIVSSKVKQAISDKRKKNDSKFSQEKETGEQRLISRRLSPLNQWRN